MKRLFVGLIIIMFLYSISTFLGIMIQNMLMLASFGYLICGESLSRKYYTIQENNYLATFSLYLYNSVKRQFML